MMKNQIRNMIKRKIKEEDMIAVIVKVTKIILILTGIITIENNLIKEIAEEIKAIQEIEIRILIGIGKGREVTIKIVTEEEVDHDHE